MSTKIKALEIGTILNNKEITEIFHCQYEGGIRKSKKLNLLVLIHDPKYGLYDNRWQGDVLYFTAIGRKGNQSLDKPWQNRDLNNAIDQQMKLYLFEKQKPSHYEYKGEIESVEKPFKETQKDEDGERRSVYIFPLHMNEHMNSAE